MVTGEAVSTRDQYSLWQILDIWLAAGVPMWFLSWFAYPALSRGLTPLDAGMLRMKLLTGGLVWQFVLSMIVVFREKGSIGIDTVSHRFWLNHPVSARTGRTRKVLWWWIIPFFLLVALLDIGAKSRLDELWTSLIPLFGVQAGYDMSGLFAPDMRGQLVGAWELLGFFVVSSLFSNSLGEEFVFRGVMLPRMEGVFGGWDWMANGVLFGFYHLHQPWGILTNVVFGMIAAFAAKRFHTNWFPIVLHNGQAVFFTILILGLVLGLG